MQVNCKLTETALDFILRIATPLSVASPDLIVSKKDSKNKLKNVIVHLPDNLNNYLENLCSNLNTYKSPTLSAMIEILARSGLKIEDVLKVTYIAKNLSRIKLTQSAVCCGLLDYLSKQNLSASDLEILANKANEIRGIKRKYIKK